MIRFAGQLLDTATSLYYLRARSYDPALGRFTSPDPAPGAVGAGYEPAYVYVGNTPTALTDPSGLCPTCVAGVAVNLGFHGFDVLSGQREFTWQGLAGEAATGLVGGKTVKLARGVVGKLFKEISLLIPP